MLLVVAYTLIGIMPTNKQLQNNSTSDGASIDRLLHRWGLLHAVRTVALTLAFGLQIAHVTH